MCIQYALKKNKGAQKTGMCKIGQKKLQDKMQLKGKSIQSNCFSSFIGLTPNVRTGKKSQT